MTILGPPSNRVQQGAQRVLAVTEHMRPEERLQALLAVTMTTLAVMSAHEREERGLLMQKGIQDTLRLTAENPLVFELVRGRG